MENPTSTDPAPEPPKPPPAPARHPMVEANIARYRAQLDAKLGHLADLQARWNTQGTYEVVRALRRDFGAEDDETNEDDESNRDKAKPRENWIQHEKESLRKAVLSFGIGRWAKLRMSLRPASRPRHDSRDVQLATWDLIRAMHRRLEPDSAEARYLADRLKRESPGGERLPADPFVGSWNLGSRAKLNAANCKVWTRRVRTIEMINRSVDRLLAEETQEDAIALAGACPLPASDVKRSLPVWWDGTCDFFLLYGVYRHGFGNFHSVRSDPWAVAVATEAARCKGGDAAVAQLRESIAAVDEHHRLYLQAREHHGAAITAGAAAKRKEDKAEEDDDADAEGDETDTEHAMHVTTPGGDKSELANAKERAERLHEGEFAWPRPEDLTDRVRRVAKDLGDPGALKPSDPPWVRCVLGHKRRVPKPSMSTAERAAREVKRGAMRSKASDADGAAEEQDGAMTRGEWDCLGVDGADASVGKLLCADHPGFNALTGVNPEADESVRSLIHSLRESGITTRVRKDVLKALMRHGLPRRSDHAPDWTALGANAGIARDVGTIQRVFHATACEMRVLEARTAVTGLKAASKGEIRSGKTHAPGCKCIVCRIRVAKTTAADPTKVGWRDAVKAMKDGGVKDGGVDASPQGENTAASSPAADGNDDDDDDEGHDNDNDDDGNDEDEGDDEGDKKEGGDDPDGGDTPVKGSQDEKGSRRRGGGAPFGLLTAITANRLRERLDMTQTLRMCLEKNNGTMAGLPMPVIKTGELPRWWTPGVHDIAVLRAAMKHGCDGWSELAADPQFTSIFGKSRPVPKGPLCFRVLRIATRALRRGYLGLAISGRTLSPSEAQRGGAMLLDDLPQDVFDKVLRSGLHTQDIVRVMGVSRQMRRQAGSERVWREIVWWFFGIKDASETWDDLADREPMDTDDAGREALEYVRGARWRKLYAHLHTKFNAGEAHAVSARGLYTDGGCDENDGDNFAGNLFNPDRHDRFFCSATSGNINCVGVFTMEDATAAHEYAEEARRQRKYMISRCALTAKVQDKLTQMAHDQDPPELDYERVRRECYEHDMTEEPFDFSAWPDSEIFNFYIHHLALAVQGRNEMGKLLYHAEPEIIFDDDADSWTKHPRFPALTVEMRDAAIAWQRHEEAGPPTTAGREEEPDPELWRRLMDARERGWGLGANSEGGGWVPTADTPLRLLNSGLAMEEFGLGGDGECMLHHTRKLDAIVREHGYGSFEGAGHSSEAYAEFRETSERLSRVHEMLEMSMHDLSEMHRHKERPSANTRRAKRDIDACFWYGKREGASSGLGHPRRDVVLNRFEINRSGQFTCPVGCGAVFVSRGPPDVDQTTRERYANHIFYMSEGAKRWRRCMARQPFGFKLERKTGGLEIVGEGWPEDADGPLTPFLGAELSLFPDAAAVGDWVRAGCEHERSSTVFDGIDSLQKVRDGVESGVLPQIVAIHTSAAGEVVEFEANRCSGGETEPRFQPVAWFRFKPKAETLASQRNDPYTDVLTCELVRKRCGRMVSVKLIACEDLMAQWEDHHDAPNVDCRSFSFHGVPVELGAFLSPEECRRNVPYDTSHLATETFEPPEDDYACTWRDV